MACKVTLYRTERPFSSPVVSFTRDIGMGGLFAETDEEFTVGERVDVVLAMPSTWEPLVYSAVVCRLEGARDETARGVGLRFSPLSDAQTLALAELTASLDYDG